jgi:hypothetical protein
MKNNQDIGAALKSKLEDYQNSPDDFVWDAIENKLKKKKRRLIFWYFTFGLGVLILGLFIFNPFKTFIDDEINDSKFQKQDIEIIEQKGDKNRTSYSNFEAKKTTEASNTTLNTDNQSSQNTDTTRRDSVALHKTESTNTKGSKNVLPNTITSEKQKLNHSLLNKNENNKSSKSTGLYVSDTRDSIINTNKSSQKTTLIKQKISTLDLIKESVSDSILKTEDDVLTISEVEKEKEELIEDHEKIKDSITEREIRWSINPQLIQSNYGAFNAKTKDISSTNYGLLLGIRMTNNTFLRFGVRKLDLSQIINNTTRSVSYLEFPLEIKYLFSDQKLNPYISGGLSYFKLGDRSTESPINLEYNDNMSLNFGLGLEYKIFDRLYLNLESNFNYQIKPITSNIDYTPYIFSISTGIDYRF